MRWMLVVAAAMGLTGCMTYSELQQLPPAHKADSLKSPDAVSQCVMAYWLDKNALTHIVPSGATRTVVYPNGNLVLASVTVTPSGSGSHVEFRFPPNTQSRSSARHWEEMRKCM